MTDDVNPTGDRLRVHPQERFSAPQRKIDLDQATAELRAEARTGSHGHHQKTLYKHGNATIALFLFKAGGDMKQHKTAGTVSIHVLDGRLRVTADGEVHELTAGQLVVLAPSVPHDLMAEEESRMLLTVQLTAG